MAMMSLWAGLGVTALAGGLIALMGVGYRWGEKDRISSMQIAMLAYCVGAAVYAGVGWREIALAPGWFWLSASLVGVSQYLLIRMIGVALKLGPLSPLWCALMLNFIPVILYSCWFLGEKLDFWQVAALGCGVLAVLAASRGGSAHSGGLRGGFDWRYALALVALLCLNCVINLVMKLLAMTTAPELGTGEGVESWLTRCGNLFMCLVYLSAALLMGVDLTVTKRWRSGRIGWYAAGVTAFGSIAGMGLQKMVLAFPAALIFTVNCSASIVVASLISTCCFGEKRSGQWYATVLLALASIALANLGPLCG